MLMLSLHVPRDMQPLVELRPLLSGISLPDCHRWLAYTLSGMYRHPMLKIVTNLQTGSDVITGNVEVVKYAVM